MRNSLHGRSPNLARKMATASEYSGRSAHEHQRCRPASRRSPIWRSIHPYSSCSFAENRRSAKRPAIRSLASQSSPDRIASSTRSGASRWSGSVKWFMRRRAPVRRKDQRGRRPMPVGSDRDMIGGTDRNGGIATVGTATRERCRRRGGVRPSQRADPTRGGRRKRSVSPTVRHLAARRMRPAALGALRGATGVDRVPAVGTASARTAVATDEVHQLGHNARPDAEKQS
jgi:hypothetical protein